MGKRRKKTSVDAVILAAGKGKRIKSDLPKVLHPVLGKPALFWVLDAIDGLVDRVVIVLGYGADKVRRAVVYNGYEAEFVHQRVLNGTGGAVKAAMKALKADLTLVLCGDMPLILRESIKALISSADKNKTGAILGAFAEDPGSYGRLWVDKDGLAEKVVEYSDMQGQDIPFINTGAYCVFREKLKKALAGLRKDNRQGEYYLTDIVSYLYDRQMGLSVVWADEDEALGINSRQDLALAEEIARMRIIESHMDSGVTVHMPETVWIEEGVRIGRDTEIMPFTVIRKDVRIGKGCQIGPFAHLRSGTQIGDNSIVGNFVEINRSNLKNSVYVKHLTYLGDTSVGDETNIGAGTITANYDGRQKHKTKIGRHSFIGSGAILVAPVKVGDRAVVGAGAVVTRHHDVANGDVVVGVPARSLSKNRSR